MPSLAEAERMAAYGKLVATVAHEVRNPLFALQTAAYVIEEAKKETISILRMFKEDPLKPFGYYLKNMVLPGAGLGLEG